MQAPAGNFEIGLYSFAEPTPDPQTGKLIITAQRLRDLIESIEPA
ncbi:MAG: LLM class flavin-dependent oxidoreductase, partial [Chloroflexota bacterium]